MLKTISLYLLNKNNFIKTFFAFCSLLSKVFIGNVIRIGRFQFHVLLALYISLSLSLSLSLSKVFCQRQGNTLDTSCLLFSSLTKFSLILYHVKDLSPTESDTLPIIGITFPCFPVIIHLPFLDVPEHAIPPKNCHPIFLLSPDLAFLLLYPALFISDASTTLQVHVLTIKRQSIFQPTIIKPH